jgi:hypothetical protein
MSSIIQNVRKLGDQRVITLIILVLSICLYLIQGFDFSKHMHPMMDEGSYLLKGLYYLKGIYSPYQDYGPITNKPPFSFYSLGLSQLIEPGIRSGRYFSILLGVGVLLGLWFTIKRLFNVWWAACIVLLASLSPALIMYSSKAMTQVVTSLLIIWMLYFILGEDRKPWQLYLGGILSVFLPLTRQNLLPLYILTAIYIVWEHGKKGWYAAGISILLFIIALFTFWPGLFVTYAITFLPEQTSKIIFGLLKINIINDPGVSNYLFDRSKSIIPVIVILFQGIRNFFVPIIATVILAFILSYKEVLANKKGKACFYLLVSYIGMIGLHYLAIVLDNTLINNFPSYLAFFWPLGMVLIPFCFTMTTRNNDKYLIIVFLFTLLFFTGLGFSLFEVTSDFLLHLQIPRYKDFHFLPGTIEITNILTSKLNMVYKYQRYMIGCISGFAAGLTLLFIAWITWLRVKKKYTYISYTRTIFIVILLVGIIATPTKNFGGDSTIIMCNTGDILTAQEKVARELSGVIPKNSLVYYLNKTSIPLLYLPDVRIFPSLINKDFYYRLGGNDQELEKYGYWNDSLSEKWMVEADYLILARGQGKIINDKRLISGLKENSHLLTTSNLVPCVEKTNLQVYKVSK